MFGLVVRFTLKEGAAAGFDQLVQETVPQIDAKEPGTLVYAVHTVTDDPRVRCFYELYRDRAAFDAHEQQPHVKRFLAQREQYLETTEVDWLDLQTAAGISDQGPA
jgi:quinol monooxygenase YgiN